MLRTSYLIGHIFMKKIIYVSATERDIDTYAYGHIYINMQ